MTFLQFFKTNKKKFSGDHWGAGPQSAEVVSEDCLDFKHKLGCGIQVKCISQVQIFHLTLIFSTAVFCYPFPNLNVQPEKNIIIWIQEIFRGCADICIGNFCPKDQQTCDTVEDVKQSMSHNATLHSSALMESSSASASSALVTTVSPSLSSSIITINTPYHSPTRTPTSMTSSATTATATTSKPNAPSVALVSDDNSICRHAGVKKPFYTEMGDAYCRSRDGNGILCFGYT